MAGLDTTAYMSTGKWRRIDDSDTVCVDVVALLITRSSYVFVARVRPDLLRLLTAFFDLLLQTPNNYKYAG